MPDELLHALGDYFVYHHVSPEVVNKQLEIEQVELPELPLTFERFIEKFQNGTWKELLA
jgi:hypothetical protein